MNTIKRFFSNNYVVIIAALLLIGIAAGTAAFLRPAGEQAVDDSNCSHDHYRYNDVGTDPDGSTVYSFICTDCRTIIRETPSTSSFVLHKPLVTGGKVIMNAPWEVGAYYTTDGVTTYKPFTSMSDDWYSDGGKVWETSTAMKITESTVRMVSSSAGDGALTYIAEKDCYIRPHFELFSHLTGNVSVEFAIFLNGVRVFPADGNIEIEAAAANTQIQDQLNVSLEDTWIRLSEGDKLSFVIHRNGDKTGEFKVFPEVEIMDYSPLRK